MKVDFGLDLTALDRSHCEMIRAWRNDYAVYRWCRQTGPISDVEQAAWFERQSADPTIQMYLIQLRFEGKRTPIGVCGLTSIDRLNRRAEFSLYIAPEHHRRGFGRESLKLLLQHAFLNLGLDQVWGESFDGNPAIKLFESIGFKFDGTRRQFYFKDGKPLDAHMFSILRDEWIQTLPRSSLSPPDSTPSSASPLPPEFSAS